MINEISDKDTNYCYHGLNSTVSVIFKAQDGGNYKISYAWQQTAIIDR